MRSTARLTLPTTLSVVILAACASTPPAADVAATDSASDTAVSTCADPNALPAGTDFGCWTCPSPPEMATTYPGQPGGYRCSVCTPDPRITMRPRGDCYACTPPDGGTPEGFC